MQSLEAVSISESATFSLDKSGSDEAWSPVLLQLPTTVPLSGSTVALDGLGGEAGRFLHSLFKARPSLQYQFGNVFVTLCRAVFTPNLNFLGAGISPLVTIITKWTAGRVVPLFLSGTGYELRKWAPHGGVPTQGISGKRGTRGGGLPVGQAGLLEGLEPVNPPAQVQWCCWDMLTLLHGGGQHFAHIAKGNCRRNVPG